MVAQIQKKLNDSAFIRWSALVLIALMMFFGYMFVDMLSPLKSQLEATLGWDSGTFGTYAASEYFLNGTRELDVHRMPWYSSRTHMLRNILRRL